MRRSKKTRIQAAADIFSYENLLLCYYRCRKRKRYTVNATKFEEHLEDELFLLRKELIDHNYKPGLSTRFVVTKPKCREIFSVDFRDRIVHHVLINYLEPIWESLFIHQSYACRKGKGAHQAIHDLRNYIRSATSDGHRTAYYLKIDIQSFFVSLKKDILFELLIRRVKNRNVRWLINTVLYHDPTSNYQNKGEESLFDLIPDHKSLFKTPPHQGLPIGNLTSQFFANVYLNELDQFVKHTLKARYYLRYVDDSVLLSTSKQQLEGWKECIRTFLWQRLALTLHPTKQTLGNCLKGIDFVGSIVKPNYVLIRRRIVKNLKEKLHAFNNDPDEHGEHAISVINSYFGQFKHTNSFGLRQSLWKNDFGGLQKFLEPVDKNISYFVLKNMTPEPVDKSFF